MDLVTGSGLAELPARKWFTDHFGKQGLLLKLLNSKTKMNGGGSAKDRCLRREFALRIFQQHPITLMLIKAGMEWATGLGMEENQERILEVKKYKFSSILSLF